MKIFAIITGIMLLILFVNSRIRSKRRRLSFEIRIIYDRLEMSVIKNKIKTDNKLINYLKGFKYLAVNPSIADIQVLLSIIARADKSKLEISRTERLKFEATLPKETIELAAQFNGAVNELVKLSMWRIDFIFFLIWIIPPILVHKGILGLKDIFSRYVSNSQNEVAIVSYGNLMAA